MAAWAHSRRVVLLACGSFNPPTFMHLRMLEAAKDEIERDFNCKVIEGIISPVADGYGKPHLARAEHRMAMLHIATRNSNWISPDNWESSQLIWTRTISVLEHHQKRMKEKYGDDVKLVLVVGGDVVGSFMTKIDDNHYLWHKEDLQRIVKEFGIICLIRDDIHPHTIFDKIPFLSNFKDCCLGVKDEVCPNSISSSRIRAGLQAGRSVRYALDDAIITYIEKNNLYTNEMYVRNIQTAHILHAQIIHPAHLVLHNHPQLARYQ